MSENIHTGADQLYELVNDSKQLSLTDASRQLQYPKELILQWSDALHEAGLIQVQSTLREIYFHRSDVQGNIVKGIFWNVKSIFSNKQGYSDEEVKQMRSDLEQERQSLAAQREDMEEMQQELAYRTHILDEQKKEQNAMQQKLDEKLEVLAAKEAELIEQIAQLQTIQDILEKKQDSIEKQKKELSVREDKVSTREQQIEARLSQLEADLQSFKAQRDAFEEKLSYHQERVYTKQQEVERLISRLMEQDEKLMQISQVLGINMQANKEKQKDMQSYLDHLSNFRSYIQNKFSEQEA